VWTSVLSVLTADGYLDIKDLLKPDECTNHLGTPPSFHSLDLFVGISTGSGNGINQILRPLFVRTPSCYCHCSYNWMPRIRQSELRYLRFTSILDCSSGSILHHYVLFLPLLVPTCCVIISWYLLSQRLSQIHINILLYASVLLFSFVYAS